MGITEEEALARKKAGDPEFKLWRQNAKPGNFGPPGGMGVDGLIRYARSYAGLKWRNTENCGGCRMGKRSTSKDHHCFAARVRDAWFRQWPEARGYFAHVGSLTDSGSGVLVQLYSGRVRGGVTFTDAANGYFSGLAADASKRAFWRVVRACFDPSLVSPLFGFRPWAFIHDEAICEGPEDRAAEAAEEMRRIMEAEMQVFTPHVPAVASPQLFRAWSKKAEPVRDRGGCLVPWEDREMAK